MRVRIAVPVIVLCAVMLIPLAVAPSAFGAAFTSPVPAPGAALSVQPPIVSVRVSDVLPLVGTPVMTIGGVSKPVSVSYEQVGEEWDDEYGEYYPVYDYTSATISCSPGTVVDGAVPVTLVMASGTTPLVHSWSFTLSEKPVLSTTVPLAGATVLSATPTISVRATDNTAISNCSATIDGSGVACSYSPATQLVTLATPALSNGQHAVAVTVTDPIGNSSTKSFSFTVNQPTTTWSNEVPGRGAIVAEKPATLSAKIVCSEALSPSTLQVWVDGVKHTSPMLHRLDSKRGTVLASVPQFVANDGTHTVKVSINNVLGTTSTNIWDFRVETPPTIGTPSPLADSLVTTTGPEITVPVSDNTSIAGWTATVNGRPATASLSSGVLRVELPAALDDDARNTVSVSVTDGIGLRTEKTWSFNVQVNPEMPRPDCSTCHAKDATHTNNADDCFECHYSDPHSGTPSAYHEPAAVSDCRPCHISSLSVEHERHALTCESCHQSTDPNIVQAIADHDTACATCHPAGSAHESLHTVTLATGCLGATCHSGDSLTDVHMYSATPLTCESCHESEDSLVVSAIAGHRRECDSCHEGAGHVALHDAPVIESCSGVGCHSGDNIIDVHALGGCGACHDSPRAAVQLAIQGSDKSCSACHAREGVDYHSQEATKHTSPTTPTCFEVGCHDVSRTLPPVHTLYAGPGTVNPQYPTTCALCHANPSVDPGAAGPSCTGDCHGTNTHSGYADGHAVSAASAACTLCHGTDIPGIHGAATNTARCAVCHGDPANGTKTAECGSCHVGIDHEPVHVTTVSPDCASCHEGGSLTILHTAIGCDGCHESTDGRVVTAIEGGDKACSACHDAQPHPDLEATHAASVTSGIMRVFESHEGYGAVDWDVECAMCHASTQLLTVHADDCVACHGGSKPADSFETWGRGCQQGECHPALAHTTGDAAHSAIAWSNCETCHEPNWSVYYSTCEACHDPATTTAPTTTSNVKSAYFGAASIGFNAPGISYTFYRLDGGARTGGTSLVVAPPEAGTATHTLEYWSVDDAGNEELPHKTANFTVTADTIAPVTTSNAAATYIGPATIQLSATDNSGAPVAATYWRLNGGGQNSGLAVAVAQPPSGTQAHTLEYWSVDAAGNQELPHKIATFTITADTVAPTTTTNAPLYDRSTTTLRVYFSATDPAPSSGIAATYRRQSIYTVASNYLDIPATQGTHTFHYWSVDRAGNTEVSKTHTLIRDWTAPNTTSNAVANYTGLASIHLTATDSGPAGIDKTYFRLDGGTQREGIDVVVDTSGVHTLEFWSVDRAGNVGTHRTVTFTVSGGTPDTTPPVTSSDAVASYPGPAVIRLTATDTGGSGVASTRYRLDGGAETVGTVVNVPASTSGTVAHTLQFWSIDLAGNVESVKTVNFNSVYSATGTITLMWYAPDGSWANYWIYDADGDLVASASSDTIPGWYGFYTATVPVDPRPYHWVTTWYDPDWGDEGVTEGDALIDYGGKAYSSWY